MQGNRSLRHLAGILILAQSDITSSVISYVRASSNVNSIAVFWVLSRHCIFLDFEFEDVEVSYRPSSSDSGNWHFPSECLYLSLLVCKGAKGTEICRVQRTFSNCGVVKHHRSGVPGLIFEIVWLTVSQTMVLCLCHLVLHIQLQSESQSGYGMCQSSTLSSLGRKRIQWVQKSIRSATDASSPT